MYAKLLDNNATAHFWEELLKGFSFQINSVHDCRKLVKISMHFPTEEKTYMKINCVVELS